MFSLTGYALAKVHTISSLSDRFNWNYCIWNIKTLPKLKHFLWKIMNKALPVGEALSSRGIIGNTICKRCGDPETELHVLLQCSIARSVWDLAPLLHKPEPLIISSPTLLLQACRLTTCLPPTGISTPLYPWILWNLWTGRNKLLFEDRTFTAEEIVGKAITEARSWQNAQLPVPTPPQKARFIAPTSHLDPDTIKCFFDASWLASSGAGGLGWVFKDFSGNFFGHGSSNRTFIGSALMAEALAVKAALTAALSTGFRKLECFSDSKSLVSLLSSNSSAVEIQGILHDIVILSGSFESISFSFIPRVNNVIADGLAKSACNLSIVSTLG